jgi:hypothetical protein
MRKEFNHPFLTEASETNTIEYTFLFNPCAHWHKQELS